MKTRWGLLLAALLAGCGQGAEPPAGVAPARVVYTRTLAEKTYGNCRSEDGCTRITLRWPMIVAAPTAASRESIDAFIRAALHQAYDGGSSLAGEEEVMMDFVTAYRAFALSHPEAARPWRFERRIEPLGDTLGLSSLAVSQRSVTGGAHPVETTRLVTFDLDTGRALAWSDLLLESARARLDSIGERAFRRVRKLGPDENLGAAGFLFEDGRFHLNENLAVTTTGLMFFFNDSEIGPHALGATQISLPWSEVRQFVRPDGPLGRAAARSR